MRSNRGEHDPGPALFLCAACLCCVRGGVTASRLHQTPPEEQETGRTCCGSWERWIWGFLSSGTCLLCGAGHEWRWVLLGFAALSFGLQASSCLFRVPGSWNQLGVSGADALPSSSSSPPAALRQPLLQGWHKNLVALVGSLSQMPPQNPPWSFPLPWAVGWACGCSALLPTGVSHLLVVCSMKQLKRFCCEEQLETSSALS